MSRVTLGQVCREYKGKAEPGNGSLPVVGLEHLSQQDIDLLGYSNDETTFTKGFKKGHVLFGRRRAYLKKASLAPFDGVCSGDIIVIEADEEKLLPNLLPFIIQNDFLFDFAVENSAGSLSPRVKWKDLSRFEFDLPAMEDQVRLSELLWAAQETKRAYTRLVSACDEIIKSRFIEMFGDPLDPTDDCEVCRLGDRCEIITGNTPARARKEYYGPGIDWIKSDNIVPGAMQLERAKEQLTEAGKAVARLAQPGWLLMICIAGSPNTIGNTALVDREVAYNQQINGINPRGENSLYLQTVLGLLKPRLTAGLNAALKCILNKSMLSAIEVPFPSRDKQNEFATFVQQVDKSEFALKKAIEGVAATMNAILNKELRIDT